MGFTSNSNLQPLVIVYVVSTAVLWLKTKAANFYGVNPGHHPPEDVVLKLPPAVEDSVEATRRSRVIANDLENIPVDVAVFWAALLVVFIGSVGGTCSSEALALSVLFPVYVAFRVLYTYFYIAGKQPYRTASMSVSLCAAMAATGVLISAGVRVFML